MTLVRDGETVLAGRTKLLYLLAYLASEDGRPVPRERLATLLWGDRPEPRARASLREALSRLRAALDDAIEIDRSAVRVPPDRLVPDVRRLEEAVRAGRLDRAAELYGGEFLPGGETGAIEGFRAWVEGERERLRRLHLEAVEGLVAEAESRADWGAAVGWAERWAEAAPLSEPAQRALFRALALDGRVGEARAAWSTYAVAARRELGVESEEPALPGDPTPVRRRVGSAAVFSPDLVGRERAFRELVEAWEAAQSGHARGLLVVGESGLGKSRLLQEFAAWMDAREEAGLVLRAEAHPDERSVPLALARLLLAPLRLARGLSGAGDGALAEVATLVPEIRERFPDLPSPRGEPALLADALRRVLEDVAAEAPVLLCVDDLHHADDESLRLLAALARHLPARTLLLATSSAGEEARDRLVAEGVAGALDGLPLLPLSEAETEAMVASMIELDPTDRVALAALVHGSSGGNPFVAAEQLATLVDEGHVRAGEDGVWRIEGDLDPDQLPVPTTVAEATARRLARLPAPLRQTLSHAALLWPERDLDLLAALGGLSRDEAAERLDALLSRRLLRSDHAAGGHYAFAHDVLRKVAYDAIPPHRRARLHATTARILRERGRSGHAQALADRHRERAGVRLLRRRPRRLARPLATVALLLLAGVAVIGWIHAVSRGPVEAAAAASPVLALGSVENRTGVVDDSLGAAVRDMIGTGLARVPGVRILGQSRLVELMRVVELETGTPACPSDAARRAGADQLVEASLYQRAGGGWRLDVRRVDLESGVVLGAGTVEAMSPFGLARLAVSDIARRLGVQAPPLPDESWRTRSPVAYALYEEGLRSYYAGDLLPARQRFEAALEEDPDFAMAAYYAGRAAWHPDAPAALRHLQRARELSEDGPERERLLIRGAWADLLDEPAIVAYADSLIARYPEEPMGYYLRGRSLARAGAFMDAAPFFEHVLRMGTVSPGPRTAPRHGSDAAADLASAYAMADSLPTAERIVRSWIERSPGSALAWVRLRDILEHQERFDEALAAADVARRLHDAPDAYDTNYSALIALKREDFAAAEAAFDRLIRDGSPQEAKQARWFRIISLRWQGRLREALTEALTFRNTGRGSTGEHGFPPNNALAQAQVLFEMGRHSHAAALFDSLATTFSTGASQGHSAHQRTWMLTHSADALAAAGDTAALAVLADSLERLGRHSSLGRDWILHHHVRGLLAVARHDWPAAETQLRLALFSTRAGFTRTNYLLARVLLDRGKPVEAVELLQPIFRAPVDVSNFYLARTEARALLGEAWLRAGRADSALHHLQRARAAWDRADPDLLPRRDRLDSLLREVRSVAR